jgi:hypothetical protein
MASVIFPDDPDLASVHATEAFGVEQTSAYVAEQLEAKTAAAEVEVAEAFAEEAMMEARAVQVAEARAEEVTVQAATMADL